MKMFWAVTFQCTALKSWEEPGDEARPCVH